jgi:hypothetical protein
MKRWLALLPLALTCRGQALLPSQQALLDRVAEYARDHERRLPDFVCTRITRRSQDKSGAGDHWQLLDTLEEEVTFTAGRESYKVLKHNGKPVKPTAHVTSGFRSAGEFGTILAGIFAADSHTTFQWDPAGAFRFRVAREHSDYKITQAAKRVAVGFGGLLYPAGDSGAVERLHVETDEPEGLIVGGVTTDVQFIEVNIAGQPYRLAGRAETRVRRQKILLKREMEFRDYHKYTADTSVTFAPPK